MKHSSQSTFVRGGNGYGILDIMPRRYQNGKLQTRSDVGRPYYYVRVTKPVIDERTGERIKKRVDEKLGFTDEITRDEAMKYRARKLDEINSHRVVAPSLVRFSDLAARYLSIRATTHSSATRAWEATQIQNHMVPAFGAMKLSEIDRMAVEQWLAAKPHLSWWTKDGLRRLLGRIFTAAEEWGWFEDKKPTLGIRLGRVKLVYQKKLLTVEQFRLLLAALDDEMRFLVLILFGLGLRISEALGLKWSDLDWDAQTIALQRRWHRGDLSEAMKTEGSAEVMRLSASLFQEFHRRFAGVDIPARRETDGAKAHDAAHEPPRGSSETRLGNWADRNGERPRRQQFIFIGESGNPPDDRDLGRERLRPIMKRLGIYTKGNMWHQFRRMHVSYLQQGGATPLEAMKSARHASLDLTYLYTLTDAEREVSQQQRMFDKLMDGGTKQ